MRLHKMLFALVLCLSLSVVAYAHPGRTDSEGGHTDSSTGEYHYHHGYPAHQHYDMDDDGDLDCPYSFDDKTGSSGNKSESTKKTTKKESAEDWVENICCLVLGLGVVFLPGLLLDAIKKKLKK